MPYTISSQFSSTERAVIARGIKNIQDKTCLRITPRTNERDYISVIKGCQGCCYSYIGKIGGRQFLSLGNGCVFTGIVIHEFLHAAGFWLEQSRSDRDNYITVNYQNIRSGYERQLSSESPSPSQVQKSKV